MNFGVLALIFSAFFVTIANADRQKVAQCLQAWLVKNAEIDKNSIPADVIPIPTELCAQFSDLDEKFLEKGENEIVECIGKPGEKIFEAYIRIYNEGKKVGDENDDDDDDDDDGDEEEKREEEKREEEKREEEKPTTTKIKKLDEKSSDVAKFAFAFCHLTYVDPNKLPNGDRIVAGKCLQEYMKQYPTKSADILSKFKIPEFLYAFCSELNPTNVEFQMKIANKDHIVNAETIKACLKENESGIFKKYLEIGNIEEKNRQDKASLKEEKDETIPTDFSTFALGVCLAGERVNFIDLIDRKDRYDMVQCVGECFTDLLTRLENRLKTIQEDINKEFTLKKTVNDFEIDFQQQNGDLGDVEDYMTMWLKTYDELYSEMYINNRKIRDSHDSFVKDLRKYIMLYEGCAIWKCAIRNSNDIPCHEILNNDLEDDKLMMIQSSGTILEKIGEIINDDGENKKEESNSVLFSNKQE